LSEPSCLRLLIDGFMTARPSSDKLVHRLDRFLSSSVEQGFVVVDCSCCCWFKSGVVCGLGVVGLAELEFFLSSSSETDRSVVPRSSVSLGWLIRLRSGRVECERVPKSKGCSSAADGCCCC
jgi:hypothetical protein